MEKDTDTLHQWREDKVSSMSADNPETEEERIQYAFEVSFGSYLLERQAAGETSIDLKELDTDLLKRFFRSGWRTAHAFLSAPEETPTGGHAIGWDGCPSCVGCAGCTAADGDCCVDCTYDREVVLTRRHDCPKCHCDGGTCGRKYSNQICNCEGHPCGVSLEAEEQVRRQSRPDDIT